MLSIVIKPPSLINLSMVVNQTMKISTAFKDQLSHTVTDEVVVEKIRWSLRQRLRKQLHQLNLEFFDEVDDFFFSSSKQVQTDEENIYLIAMREIRCKQSLYEENFLNAVLARLERAECLEKNVSAAPDLGAGFERVEIDIAFRAMHRKADKAYSVHIKQIELLNQKLITPSNDEVVSGLTLIQASVHAFINSQTSFELPLHVRLVFIKLFEQHFLLRMEKLLIDISSILNNASNPEFVEKLYSSSSAFGKNPGADQKSKTRSNSPSDTDETEPTIAPEDVEAEVSELIAQLCDSHRMPLFIERMLRNQWKSVLHIVGLNMGCHSSEWNDAKYCALTLAAAASEGAEIGASEQSLIMEQLSQGFNLVRIGKAVQDSFFRQLHDLFGSAVDKEAGDTYITRESAKSSPEASISPSGKRVLSQDDLNELANLMGGSEKTKRESEGENQLNDYFAQVDSISPCQRASYKNGQEHQNCKITATKGNGFEIQFDADHASIRHSRLSLAMSLKLGDLLLERGAEQSPSNASATVISRHLH